MQVTETVSDGLKRQLKVTVPAGELKTRVDTKLEDLKSKVKLNGFRPGKVPMERVRQLYGRSVMAEVLEETVGETSTKALQDRKERPAFQPDIKLPEDQAAVTAMVEGTTDLEFTMSFEVLPKIELADLKSIHLTKDVAHPLPGDVEQSLSRLMKTSVSYEAKDGSAETGDRLTVDYKGSIRGEPFEGGAGEDAHVILGSGRFIPGFEDGLLGAKAGGALQVRLTFPADYQAEHLAGQDAVFDVTVKEVERPVEPERNDEFAKSVGVESFSKLEEAIRAELQKELDKASRSKLKKALLDALDERHTFELPASLIESEFEGIWRNITKQMEGKEGGFEAEGTTEDKARDEYRRVAERRVRLGLILSEIGTENQIRIGEEELRRAVIDRARQFPGQEREVLEFYKKNTNALNELRAPVYEDKVISFALELAHVQENEVTPQELLSFAAEQDREQALYDAGEDPGAGHDHTHHDHDHEHHVHGPDCDHDHT